VSHYVHVHEVNARVCRPPSGIDKSNLEWLEQLFRQTVGNEREIRRDDFKKIVISKNVSVARKLRCSRPSVHVLFNIFTNIPI